MATSVSSKPCHSTAFCCELFDGLEMKSKLRQNRLSWTSKYMQDTIWMDWSVKRRVCQSHSVWYGWRLNCAYSTRSIAWTSLTVPCQLAITGNNYNTDRYKIALSSLLETSTFMFVASGVCLSRTERFRSWNQGHAKDRTSVHATPVVIGTFFSSYVFIVLISVLHTRKQLR